MKALNIPGYQNSGAAHWQTIWEKEFPWLERVQMPNWDVPELNAWKAELEASVQAASEQIVLLGHSLAGPTIAHLDRRFAPKIAGAFIVAPPDLAVGQHPPKLGTFHPVPMKRFGFPSIVVASTNDPYCKIESAERMAHLWGSEFINLGEAGHINAASVGSWPTGRELFLNFVNKCYE